MDIAVSVLRANLSEWIGRVGTGEEVIVTEHGVPVARLVPMQWAARIEELTEQGVISRPESVVRPKAMGRKRVVARGSVSDLVADQRDRS